MSLYRDVAEIPCGPRARVYEHGWQSWSPTGAYPAEGTSPRPVSPVRQVGGYRPEKRAPATGFQGEGLLAVDPGDGEPVRVWWAPDPDREVASIRARHEGGRVIVSSDGELDERTFPGDLETVLGQWAEEFGRARGVERVPALPPAWCTWYHYFGAITEADVIENLEAIDRFGLDVGIVQLDAGYEPDMGDWLLRVDRFPHPLSELADRIRATGRRAGIWVAPMMVGEHSALAVEHPDWLVGGTEASENTKGRVFALDVTHPDAAAYLDNVFRTFAGWGFDYFKIDFMYAGALEGSRRADCSGLDAYLEALRLIREAIGPDSWLLGCGAPILPSVGRVDAMRISPDISVRFEHPSGDLMMPAQRAAVLNGRSRAFQHGRLWVNDPDCLIVRPAVERREEWAEHVGRFSGLRVSSDRLEALDEWGLETTHRLLQPSSPLPLPLTGDSLDSPWPTKVDVVS